MYSELRMAFRALAKSPLFAIVAIASLALGLGANTAIFNILDQILLRPLPVSHAGELALVTSPGPARGSFSGDNTDRLFSRPEYIELRDRNTVFSGLVARTPAAATLSYQGSSEAISAELVSGNFFDVLGVGAARGRLLSQQDDLVKSAHPVIVLSHAYWMRRFAGDSGVLGKTVRVNNTSMTVIGVSAPGFIGVDVGRSADLFVPLAMKTSITITSDGYDDRSSHYLHLIGCLKPGIGLKNAQSQIQGIYGPMLQDDLNAMTGTIPQKFRERFLKKQIVLESAASGVPTLKENVGTPLYILMGMVGLVLLIACANVANLLIARGIGRQKEIAIRLALGASRADVIRQLMTESVLLAMLGALAGLLAGMWTSSVLIRLLPPNGPSTAGLDGSLDPRAVAFTFALALVTGIAFGVLPAIQTTKPDVYPVLKNQAGSVIGNFGQIRSRQALVVAQVALSLLLLVGAGLFTRSLANLRALNPGFRTDHMALFYVDASRNGYAQPRIHEEYEDIRQRLAATPGVTAVSLSEIVPLSGDQQLSGGFILGYTPKPDEIIQPNINTVSPGYFSSFGIPILAGRDFTEKDRLGAPKVAIVNESFAKRYFGPEGPIGRRMGFHKENVYDIEIAGVVKDGKYNTLRDADTPFVFLPYLQDEQLNTISMNVRTAAEPETMMPTLRRVLAAADPNLPLWELRTMQAQVDESLFSERIVAGLCAVFGALATLLASIGLYGVTAFSVARRTREIGIRVALGAARGSVLRMVLKEVAWMAAAGIGLGIPLAIGLSRFIASQLYGVRPGDVLTIGAAALILLAVSALAGFVPAQRAASVDPLVALRYE